MKSTVKMTLAALAVSTSLALTPATAQTTGSTTPPPPTTGTAATNLSNNFSNWAGSPENSAALVNGLRTGQPINLTSAPTTPGGTVTGTTFTSPTKPMGYGNIKIALSLAQQQLASQGITQPTTQQLQTALMGGSITTTDGVTAQTTNYQGILQMRASGMGWGKIANTLGYKLGAVMSGKAAATPATGTTTAAGTDASGSAKTQHGKAGSGITTAAGAGDASGSAKTQHGKAGSGITTASGGTGGGISTGMGGSANAHAGAGAGIVSAHGGAAGGGQSHAGGQGKSGK